MAKRLTRGSKLYFIGKTKDNVRVYRNEGYYICVDMDIEEYSAEIKVIKRNRNFPDIISGHLNIDIKDYWRLGECIETTEKRVLKNIRIGYETFEQIVEFNFEHKGIDIEIEFNNYNEQLDEFLKYPDDEDEEIAKIIWQSM